ncbi:hypothetical protein E2542_SST28372 [Spatholobus suberectus]|nr:hypothetical protein E2542_SST28372 [Spatholobus suberectus]
MQTNFLRLFVILLVFSYVISIYAIPATSKPHNSFSRRTKNLNREKTSIMPLAQLQGALKFENGEMLLVDVEEGLMERREDLETQDYGGTGANRDHDPKAPGLHG